MSIINEGEKKFVIKHTFKDVKNSGVKRIYEGDREKHFGVPWRIRLTIEQNNICIYLDCLKVNGAQNWKISTEIDGKIGENKEAMNLDYPKITYPSGKSVKYYSSYTTPTYSAFYKVATNGILKMEFEVKITEMSGMEIQKMRNFDGENAKEHSDIALVVDDQKFHVYKSYLSLHSSYFESLFSKNFEESKKSEIELKDIDPNDLQKFLEVLYGEAAINEENFFGILELADMYDSKTVIQRCEEFFLFKSGHSLREKFHVSLKYKLGELKKKCMSEVKVVNDYHAILPQNSGQFDTDVWEELLRKALTISN